MNGVIFLTIPDAEQYCTLVAKLLGYPKQGANIGDGRHVTISGTPGGVGWSDKHNKGFQHPTLSLWACAIDSTVQSALTDPQYTQNVTPAELSYLTTTTALAQVLTPDWFS